MLIAVDIIFIPRFSYWACAWAGFVSYTVSMVLSYFFGQKYYPIKYPLKSIAVYVVLALLLFAGMTWSNEKLPMAASLGVNTVLLIVYAVYVVRHDLPLSSLPVIGKKFRK